MQYIHIKVVEGPIGASIALGLKKVENGDTGYHHITIASMCDTYFGTRAQKISRLLVVIEAVPMYVSARFTCPTGFIPVALSFKGT